MQRLIRVNTVRIRQKKKLLDSQTPFFSKIYVCGQLNIFTLIFWLGTFLDIWVCLAKQNGGGFTISISKMQV